MHGVADRLRPYTSAAGCEIEGRARGAESGQCRIAGLPAKWPYVHTMQAGSPHARYAIAERANDNWIVDLIEVAYDWEDAARMAEAHGRADWASGLRTGKISD